MNKSRATPVATFTDSSERALERGPYRQGSTVAAGLEFRPGHQQKLADRKAHNLLQLRLTVKRGLFCANCGKKRKFRGDENSALVMTLWLKIKKCTACTESRKPAGDVKYCRVCGESFPRGDIGAKAWASVSLCAAHRPARK